MAREKKGPKGPPPPAAWLATFADLMNLLLCFFVLLFSMSSVDAKKFEEVAASLASAFSVLPGGAMAIGDGMMISNGVSQLNELSEYFSTMGLTDEGEADSKAEAEKAEDLREQYEQQGLQEAERMAEEIEQMLAQETMKSDIEIDFTSQYVSLTMNGALLFDSGKADIKQEALVYLDKINTILLQYEGNLIEIIGHTDNVPIASGRYADNMELSCFRAMAVARYLTEKGDIALENLQYSGRGEYVPIASNDTSEGRAQNRRVEIRIHRELSGH